MIFILVLTVGGPLALGADKKPKVVSLRILGNDAFPEDRLEGLMAMRPGGFLATTRYSRQVFMQDLNNVLAFYAQHGYLDAQVVDTAIDFDSTKNEIALGLEIAEGAVTRLESIKILGNRALPDSTLRAKITLQRGDAFNRYAIENGIIDMLNVYADTGYLEAAIEPSVEINREAKIAMVDLTVRERAQSTIARINITGNEKTNRSVVVRELSFQEGEIVDYAELMASQRRLYLTGLFESVFIRPEFIEGRDSTEKEIHVDLKEAMSGEFFVTLGYGTVEKVRGRIEASSKNVAGTARKLGATVEASAIRQAITLSGTEPRTFGSRFQTDLNIFGELQQEPGYDLSKYGGRLSVGKEIWDNGRISVTYRIENGKLTNIRTDSLPDDFRPRVRSLIFTVSDDSRNDLFDPSKGTYLEFTAEMAGGFLQGTNSFGRIIARGKHFMQLDRKTVLASSLTIGWMDDFGFSDEIPLNERFYAGGPTVLRSFEYQKAGPLDGEGNPLGGKFKVTWNLVELRRAIWKMIGGVVFVDVGNVWSELELARFNDIKTSLGVGIRASTPIGIVRLDWSVNPYVGDFEKPNNIYFSMGHAF